MQHSNSSKRGYILAAFAGALGGGIAMVFVTKAIPRLVSQILNEMMSKMPRLMAEHMKSEGFDPAEMCTGSGASCPEDAVGGDVRITMLHLSKHAVRITTPPTEVTITTRVENLGTCASACGVAPRRSLQRTHRACLHSCPNHRTRRSPHPASSRPIPATGRRARRPLRSVPGSAWGAVNPWSSSGATDRGGGVVVVERD